MIRRLMIAAAALALAGCADTMMSDDAAEEAAVQTTDVVSTAQSADNLTTLVAAIQAADLVETLSGPGPFTVFAPTDEAFAALPDGVLERLLQPENKGRLRALLAYHVVPGTVRSGDIAGQAVEARTALQRPVTVDATGAGVKVGNANVVAADIEATNGVVHVIDRVIVPPPPAS